MLSALAKLGTPEMVGRYALGLAVTGPVVMLSNLQLRGVLATDANEEYRLSDYLTLRVVTSVAALLAVVILILCSSYRRSTAFVILGVAVAKTFESVSDIVYGYLQHHERMDRIAQSMMIRGLLGMVALWFGLLITGSVLVGVVGMAAVWGGILVLFDLRGLRRDAPDVPPIATLLHPATMRWQSVWRLAVVAAPLGVVMMLVSLNVNLPRYAIQHYGGERSLGVFAAVAYTMVAGTTIISALAQSATPRLAQYYATGQVAGFWSLMVKLLLVGLALGIAGIGIALSAGAYMLRILFRPEYAASANVLSWMMGAAAVSYLASFLGFGLTAARRFNVQLALYALVSAVVALASFALVPRYGLVGAAWAMTLGAGVQFAAAAFLLNDALRGDRTRGRS
jgi:O-antigen/teichoic acid export membrane protein